MSEGRFVWMPFDEVLSANGFVQIVRNHWWVVHPAKGLAFFPFNSRKSKDIRASAAQCNINKSIAERLASAYPEMEEIGRAHV